MASSAQLFDQFTAAAGDAKVALASQVLEALGDEGYEMEGESGDRIRAVVEALLELPGADAALGEATEDYVAGMTRDYSEDYPPEEGDPGREWLALEARAWYRLGKKAKAFSRASLIGEECDPAILADPAFAAWRGTAPGLHGFRRSKAGALEPVLPAIDAPEATHSHALSSQMKGFGRITITADSKESPQAFVARQFTVTEEDLARLQRHFGVDEDGLMGATWQSPHVDPNEALALLLAQLRAPELATLHEAVAAQIAEFDPADFDGVFTEALPQLWFSQSVCALRYDGQLGFNDAWLAALADRVSALSEGRVAVERAPEEMASQVPVDGAVAVLRVTAAARPAPWWSLGGLLGGGAPGGFYLVAVPVNGNDGIFRTPVMS